MFNHRTTNQVIAVIAGLIEALAVVASHASADGAGLYETTVIVTGNGEASRESGFAAALEEVLAKVSGDAGLIGNPAVAELGSDAGALVESFSFRDRMEGIPHHDEQGSRDRPFNLTVNFDTDKIDEALRAIGRTPWPEPRPKIVLLAAVDFGGRFVLAADGSRGTDMRTALATAALHAGLEVLLPTETELKRGGLDAETLATADLAVLQNLSEAAGADKALVGKLAWSDSAAGWIAEWQLRDAGGTHRYGVSGVSFDAAFRNAVRGAAQLLSGNGEPR